MANSVLSLEETFALLVHLRTRAGELAASPGFWPAVRTMARKSLEQLAMAERPLRYLNQDAGRLMVTYALLGMGAGVLEGTALTNLRRRISLMKAASRGRVDALIEYMVHVGLAVHPDGRPDRIAPTRKLTDYFGQDVRLGAEMLATISPSTPRPAKIDERFWLAFWRATDPANGAFAGLAEHLRSPLALLWDRNGGVLLFYNIIAAIPGDRPSGEGAISVAAVARSCDVSRVHVLKMLEDGREAGLLHWDPTRRTIAFSDASLTHFQSFFSGLSASHEYHQLKVMDELALAPA